MQIKKSPRKCDITCKAVHARTTSTRSPNIVGEGAVQKGRGSAREWVRSSFTFRSLHILIFILKTNFRYPTSTIDPYHGVASFNFSRGSNYYNQPRLEPSRENSVVPLRTMNISHQCYHWIQETWPRWRQHDKGPSRSIWWLFFSLRKVNTYYTLPLAWNEMWMI